MPRCRRRALDRKETAPVSRPCAMHERGRIIPYAGSVDMDWRECMDAFLAELSVCSVLRSRYLDLIADGPPESRNSLRKSSKHPHQMIMIMVLDCVE